MIGQLVKFAHDDAPCPLTGIVTSTIDDDTVMVIWGAYDLSSRNADDAKREYIDELAAV